MCGAYVKELHAHHLFFHDKGPSLLMLVVYCKCGAALMSGLRLRSAPFPLAVVWSRAKALVHCCRIHCLGSFD